MHAASASPPPSTSRRIDDPTPASDDERTVGQVAAALGIFGRDSDDPGLTSLVGELTVRSAEFAQLWGQRTASATAGPTHGSTVTRSSGPWS